MAQPNNNISNAVSVPENGANKDGLPKGKGKGGVWRCKGTGALDSEDQFNLSVSYQIFSVLNENKIRTSKVLGIPNKIKQLAHYISDGIYEEVTGLKGVASTKILYVSEQEENNKKTTQKKQKQKLNISCCFLLTSM